MRAPRDEPSPPHEWTANPSDHADTALESRAVSRARRCAAWAGLGLFAMGSLACLGMWQATRSTIEERARAELVALASAAASTVDPALHAYVHSHPDEKNEAYARAVEPLRRFVQRVPKLAYAYTLVLDGSTPRFVLDAAEPGDHDGDGVEDHSAVLEAYETKERELFEAFAAVDLTSGATATLTPYRDRWGEFLSGYAPIPCPDGRPHAVLGLDIRAEDFEHDLATARARAWLGAVPAVLLAVLGAVLTFHLRLRMLRSNVRLIESEARFRAVSDATPGSVFVTDAEGRWTWSNRPWIEFTGRSPRDAGFEGWTEAVLAEDRATTARVFAEAFAARAPLLHECRLHRADDAIRWVEIRAVPNRAADGVFRGYVGLVIDVTERHDAERSLADAAHVNTKLASAMDVVDDALCVTDAKGFITYVNRGFERQTGWLRSECVGLRTSILRGPHTDDAVYKELWSTLSSGRTWFGRLLNRRKVHTSSDPAWEEFTAADGGATYWVETTITPQLDAQGKVTGFVSLQRDVTDLVRREGRTRIVSTGIEARAAVASILSGGGTIAERLEVALRRLLTVCDGGSYARAAVYVPGSERGTLDVLARIGHDPGRELDPVANSAPVLEAVCRRVHERGVGDVLAACTEPHDPCDPATPLLAHGHIVLPLMHAGRAEGVLLLPSATHAEDVGVRLEVLTPVAELMALALVKDRAEKLLLEAMRRSDAASRAKSEFLANMSHEIRTPLTAILGYADVLAEDPTIAADPERVTPMLDTIRSAGQHLLAVVNDILDVSKIEAGAMKIESIVVDLPGLLRDTIALLQPRAAERGLSLELVWESPAPARARMDPTRLRQVVMNLVGNALKFTESGGVTVRARASGLFGDVDLALAIVDTGPGLSAEERGRLFQAFSQADASVTRRHGGTGLGLVISQRLARLMGGDVELTHSELGRGSTFTATVRIEVVADASLTDRIPAALPTPRAPAPGTSTEAAEVKPTSRQLSGRFLLAEDGRDNQRLISLHLRRAGAHVDVADNGRIALGMIDSAVARGEPYDFLVTDVQMPEMDGLTLVRTLRARGATLPIVALTAHAMAEDRDRCLAAGCDGFATKPIERAQFLPLCADLLARANAPRS